MDADVEAQLAPSRALAEFIANLRYDDIPPRVRELAYVAGMAAHLERLILRLEDTSVDTIAIACAGGQS